MIPGVIFPVLDFGTLSSFVAIVIPQLLAMLENQLPQTFLTCEVLSQRSILDETEESGCSNEVTKTK